MIRAKLLWAIGLGMMAITGLGAYRWHHPCATCPMSMAIGALGGPSGCAPAPNAHTAIEPGDSAAAGNASKETSTMTSQATPAVKTETAMFGAGCFWGVEGAFRKIPGVMGTSVGYSGGHTSNATYKQVCSSSTGHAEVVRIQFDPSKVSYQSLVEKFFNLHDPTQMNRQGPDVGTQYRSAIFYFTPEQQAVAQKVKETLASRGKYTRPIATEITQAGEFWKAEEYHQRYLEKNGLESCHLPLDNE